MKPTPLLALFCLMLQISWLNAAEADKSLAMIDDLFHDYNQPGVPGASVMIIRDGKILLAKSYGLADLENQTPVTPDTNFRLASFTKQFTAMAIMKLADTDKLSLDDPIIKFFPGFPAYGRDITVRHLLNHTSGLFSYEDLIPKDTTIPVLDINVLRLIEQQDKTYFPPGTQFRYSNTGYALLSLIVQQVSRQTFATFLRQNIFQPLKMNHTLAYEAGLSVITNRAFGYSLENTNFTRTDQSLTSSVLGDGGIYSSITDLYHWDQALYTTKLVSHKMLAEAFTPGKNTQQDNGAGYGFGWRIGTYRGLKSIAHGGNSIGFSTRIERFPEKKFTVIILTNRNHASLDEIPRKITDLYLFAAP